MNIYTPGEFFYLYKFTHNKTNLKYLGFTERDDIGAKNGYFGSGKDWIKHLNEHGYDISTEILLVTYDPITLKEMGIYYSKLWDIVKSKEWANLRPEQGYGGDTVSDKQWVTDGLNEKYILKTDQVPVGWKKGRSNKCVFKNNEMQSNFSNRRDTEKQKQTYARNKAEGKYKDSYKNRKPTFTGKTHDTKTRKKLSDWHEKNSPTRGKKWVNNGSVEMRINIENDLIPEGYILGRLKNARRCKN
jgi:hypothetical protein